MLKYKIKERIVTQGNLKPYAYLRKFCQFGQGKAFNILSGKQKAINIDDLSTLCENLWCTPNDLFYWDNTPSSRLPLDHPCITELKPPTEFGDWPMVFKKLRPDEAQKLYHTAREIVEGRETERQKERDRIKNKENKQV